MKKPSPAYKAQEVATRAGLTVRALHHYDRLGLLKPSGRTDAGYRLYRDRDFARLEMQNNTEWGRKYYSLEAQATEVQKALNQMWADKANWSASDARRFQIDPAAQAFVVKA